MQSFKLCEITNVPSCRVQELCEITNVPPSRIAQVLCEISNVPPSCRDQELCESRGGRAGLSTSLTVRTVSVDVRQHTERMASPSEFRSCVKVEVDVLDSPFLTSTPCGLCGRRATLNSNLSPSSVLILLFRSAFDLPCWTGWLPWRGGQFAAGTPLSPPPPPRPTLTPPPSHTHTPTPQLLPQVQRPGPGLTGRCSSKLGHHWRACSRGCACAARALGCAGDRFDSVSFVKPAKTFVLLSSQQKHLFFCQASHNIFTFFVQIVTAQPSNQ